MRLVREQLFGTVVTFISLAIALSVIVGWNWPIVGTSVTAGIIAAGVVALIACGTSGWTSRFSDSTWYRDPWLIVGMVLGTATLVVGVIGLFLGTMPYLVLMFAGIAALWLVTIAHHTLAPEPSVGRHLPTPA